MTNNKKKTFYFVAFSIIFIFVFWFVHRIFLMKGENDLLPMQNFYSQRKNSIDVLFCGGSYIGWDIDIEELWYDYGIAGYDLWGGGQPFWNSYFYLREALKYQKPKLVVLEVGAASYDFEYRNESYQMRNTQGIRFSKNFINSVLVSAPPKRWFHLFFGLTTFHSRFKELKKNDFMYFPWSKDNINDKGYRLQYGNKKALDLTDVSNITESKEMTKKEEKFFRLFIEYCREKNVTLLLLKSPSKERVTEQPYYNYVSLIAREEGIEFINTNLLTLEIGLSPEDSLDRTHLNVYGARKLSKYLGAILREKYDLPDRRNEKGYESWEVFAENTRKRCLGRIPKENSVLYNAEIMRSELK